MAGLWRTRRRRILVGRLEMERGHELDGQISLRHAERTRGGAATQHRLSVVVSPPPRRQSIICVLRADSPAARLYRVIGRLSCLVLGGAGLGARLLRWKEFEWEPEVNKGTCCAVVEDLNSVPACFSCTLPLGSLACCAARSGGPVGHGRAEAHERHGRGTRNAMQERRYGGTEVRKGLAHSAVRPPCSSCLR